MEHLTHTHAGAHGDHHHEELGFWRKYIFSTDHKIIGLQYGLTALLFLLFGFGLMLVMRWQLAYPGKPIPLVGPILESLMSASVPNPAAAGVMSSDLYNM